MDTSYSLLPDPTPIRLPLPSRHTTPILLVNACSDITKAFITQLRTSTTSSSSLAAHVSITAFLSNPLGLGPSEEAIVHWLAVHNVAIAFKPSEMRELIRVHRRVVIYTQYRSRIMPNDGRAGKGHDHPTPEGAGHHRWLVDQWIDACHAEKAEHVIYISTASPHLFHNLNYRQRGSPAAPLEALHLLTEERLQSANGIQHYTILRPVSVMSLHIPSRLPSGSQDPFTVLAKFDPTLKQQLISPNDLGRIAAIVLTPAGDAWLDQIVELAGPAHMSPYDEVTVRRSVLGNSESDEPVVCDTSAWVKWNSKGWLSKQPLSTWWIVPQLTQRGYVTQDAAHALLPVMEDYRTWFDTRVNSLEPQPREPVQHDCVIQ